MGQFSFHYARANLSKLIADALAGNEVIITRGDVPVVRLVPITPRGKRRFGALKGKIAVDEGFHEPLPEHEICGWNLGPALGDDRLGVLEFARTAPDELNSTSLSTESQHHLREVARLKGGSE